MRVKGRRCVRLVIRATCAGGDQSTSVSSIKTQPKSHHHLKNMLLFFLLPTCATNGPYVGTGSTATGGTAADLVLNSGPTGAVLVDGISLNARFEAMAGQMQNLTDVQSDQASEIGRLLAANTALTESINTLRTITVDQARTITSQQSAVSTSAPPLSLTFGSLFPPPPPGPGTGSPLSRPRVGERGGGGGELPSTMGSTRALPFLRCTAAGILLRTPGTVSPPRRGGKS